jgi:hypothetical protein
MGSSVNYFHAKYYMTIYKLTWISPNSNDVNIGNKTEVDETTWIGRYYKQYHVREDVMHKKLKCG